MIFVPFEKEHYWRLLEWVPNAAFNLLWGGPLYQYPLTLSQVEMHLSSPGVYPFMLVDDTQVIGYVEVVDQGQGRFRLCRVLVVDPNARGKGIGERLVNLAIEYAKKHFNASTMTLGVFEQNYAARRCYERLGFVYDKRERYCDFEDEKWLCFEMYLHLKVQPTIAVDPSKQLKSQ
ncbi:GNAT family N-acetyltransferase [Thaumasiovibrio subtropicus]|uniref:GNAT family N-acetyltransferase n=1 Tax=Thaumasiovibrio subtropicus TaxID=1891207 RepID=UPI00131B38AA|nr:GNAT family protein [Thaumasiovibrio subtropicus]